MKKRWKTLVVAALATTMLATPVIASENKSPRFSTIKAEQNLGNWSNIQNLTWTFLDGETVVIGRGDKYSDLHPEAADREAILNDSVYYLNGAEYLNPHDPNVWSSSGKQKLPLHDADELKLLKEFVNSFDWIHADEVTRAEAVFNKIANGYNGNRYGNPQGGVYTNFSVLKYKVGVCENFSSEFQRLANYVGLECVTYQPEWNHQACLLKINGQWLAVDPTFSASGLDPSLTMPFFSSMITRPVDYETEYSRYENEYKQSDKYKEMQEEIAKWDELNDQYWRGEITYEELQERL